VRASSEGDGQGTTLTVTLPVLPVTGLAPAAHAIAPPPGFRLNGVSVLVVDDHADSRELITTILEGLGAVVRSAGSAAEGLALLRMERPDVLVSDLEMPGESGYELIQQVRALPLGEGGLTPAVALTAYARSEDRIRVLAAGFQEHVAKPALPEELAAAIAAVVGWKRS
jgi:CheY-like chemotaxis protein